MKNINDSKGSGVERCTEVQDKSGTCTVADTYLTHATSPPTTKRHRGSTTIERDGARGIHTTANQRRISR
jgi:hypothetical protein